MSTPSSLIESTCGHHDTEPVFHTDRFCLNHAPIEPEDPRGYGDLDDSLLDIIRRCDLEELKRQLIAKPGITVQRDHAGLTALMHVACVTQSVEYAVEMFSLLLSHGADLHACDSDGFTVTHWVAACGLRPVLDILISRKPSSILSRSLNGDTPLHRACRMGRVENVATLLAFDKTLSFVLNNASESPLQVAGSVCETREDPKLRLLVRREFAKHRIPCQTLILHHSDTLMHATRTSGSQGTFPWEAPERVTGIVSVLAKTFASDPLISISTEFTPATDKDILRCHSSEYLDLLQYLEDMLVSEDPNFELRSCIPFTPAVQKRITRLPSNFMKNEALSDTSYSSGTLRAARCAAGSVIHAIDRLFDPETLIRNVFCVVRPPGHHVGYGGPVMDKTCTSCGFSILNSVAIGAVHAIRQLRKRVVILDIDVHHGNGTEDVVRNLNSPNELLFISIHQADETNPARFYPGTGFASNYASNIYNFPFDPIWVTSNGSTVSSNREKVLHIIKTQIVPLIASFRPDIILMSTGFDGANGDVGNCLHEHGKVSLHGTDLSPQDYGEITKRIMSIANIVCEGRVVSVLEGGYGKMTWTTTTVVTKSNVPDPKRGKLASGSSDDSTKASCDDEGSACSDSNTTSSGSSPTALNKRKRLNREMVHTQVLNRQILTMCAQHHVRGLTSL